MKSALKTGLLVVALGLASNSIAHADDHRQGFPRYAGTYLVDVTVDKIGEFDCQFLLELGFINRCSVQQVLTLHADGTLQGTDTIAFTDGFTGISQGNWQRAGFRSRAVSGKSISLNFSVEGDFEDYIVREFSFEFSRDRTSFSGSSSTSLFNAEQDPLDPAATPDVVITSTLAGRKLQ